MSSDENRRHAYEFLGPCLAGDVAHAKVLQVLIDKGLVAYEELGITPDDMATFLVLTRITDPKERAITAFRGCRDGRVLANFGVVQSILRSRRIEITDLCEGDDSMLKVGSDLIHFHETHTECLARLLPREEPPQD